MGVSELLPCPFCGGEASIGGGDDYAFVNCMDCLASFSLPAEMQKWDRELDIEKWNTRAALPHMQPAGEAVYFVGSGDDTWMRVSKAEFDREHPAKLLCYTTPPQPSAEPQQEAQGVVDYLGVALDLEEAEKKVISQTASRAMLRAAGLLRKCSSTPPAPVDVRRLSALAESWRKEANGWLLQTEPAELLRDCADSLLALLSAQPSADARDGEYFRWLATYPNFYTVCDLLRADQYVTLRRACEALWPIDNPNAIAAQPRGDNARGGANG